MNTSSQVDSSGFLEALAALSKALKDYPNRSNFSTSHQYNSAPLTPNDLELMADSIYVKFDIDWRKTDQAAAQEQFDDLTPKIQSLTASSVPQLHSSLHAIEAVVTTLYSIDLQLSALMTPAAIDGMLKLPSEMRRELRRHQTHIEQLDDSIGDLNGKVRLINAAFSAAENLPATLADLEVANSDIAKSRENALRFEADAKRSAEVAETSRESVDQITADAKVMMGRVNAAFRAATSEGLAREFRRKAKSLSISLGYWVLALISALGAGVYIGSLRFPFILKSVESLGTATPKWEMVVTQILLALLSLGAPIWLAWVATKQVGERFRLAEDYAYKAALSSAYEGYRTEAANLDPLLQAQLFSIALSRLDEIPLRLIDKKVAGSPMHELLQSPAFKTALDKFPDLRAAIASAFVGFSGEPPKREEPTQDGERDRG